MKRLLLLSIILHVGLPGFCQLAKPNMPFITLNSDRGYISINEFTFGAGWADEGTPYSQGYLGFTTLHARQVNERLTAGLGTGLLYYSDGFLIPLYAEGRINLKIKSIVPYLSASGGVLFNPSGTGTGTYLFITPAFGVMSPLSGNMAVNISGGCLMQIAPKTGSRQFINGKAGITYKFKGKRQR